MRLNGRKEFDNLRLRISKTESQSKYRRVFMKLRLNRSLLLLWVSLMTLTGTLGQTAKSRSQARTGTAKDAKTATKRGAHELARTLPAPNLAKEPTLYTVGYAHLDTEW